MTNVVVHKILIDGNSYEVAADSLTGLEVRALGSVPGDVDLVLEGEIDRIVPDDEIVVLEQGATQFFSRPPTQYGVGV